MDIKGCVCSMFICQKKKSVQVLKKDVGTNRGEKASEALWHRIQTEEKQSDVDCYLGGAYHCSRLKSVCGSDNWSRLSATQSDYKPRWLTSVKQGKWTVLTLHAIFFLFFFSPPHMNGLSSLALVCFFCTLDFTSSEKPVALKQLIPSFWRTNEVLLFPLFCKYSDRYILSLWSSSSLDLPLRITHPPPHLQQSHDSDPRLHRRLSPQSFMNVIISACLVCSLSLFEIHPQTALPPSPAACQSLLCFSSSPWRKALR